MNKEALFQEMKEQKNRLILELKENVKSAKNMVDLDESDTIDPEDLSHQFEGGEIQHLFEEQLFRAEEDLLNLKHIDFSHKDRVQPGAVVYTETFNFIIGIPSMPFQFNDKQYVGISTESAIFNQMKGKQKGDVFTHASKSYRINEII
jgi:hypothetical protein